MEDFVTYEQSVKLKELGFDWWGNYIYNNGNLCNVYLLSYDYKERETCIPAPTLSQVQKWLRGKDINIQVYCLKLALPLPSKLVWDYCIVDNEDKEIVEKDYTINYDTYEKALSEGIDKAIELLKSL